MLIKIIVYGSVTLILIMVWFAVWEIVRRDRFTKYYVITAVSCAISATIIKNLLTDIHPVYMNTIAFFASGLIIIIVHRIIQHVKH